MLGFELARRAQPAVAPRSTPLRVPLLPSLAWCAACALTIAGLVATVRPAASPLDELWAALAERPLDARLSSMPFLTRQPPVRGETATATPPWRVLAAAGRAEDDARSHPTALALQQLGAAALAAGQVDASVQALEDAAVADPASAAIQADLAAAYLARGARPGRAIDVARAYEAAFHARHLSPHLPAARFNEALALERLHLDGEAVRAWNTAAALEPASSGWAAEARRHAEALSTPADATESAPDAMAALRGWAEATARTADAPLPALPATDPFFAAIAADVESATGDARRDVAAAVRGLLAAESAIATPDYGAADRFASEVAAHPWPDASPMAQWAERLRLTVAFNTGRGADVRPRAERLADAAAARGFRALEADARHRLAGLDYVAGRYDQAVEGFEIAMRLRRAVGNRRGEASSRLALGDALRMLGREPEAWEQYLAIAAIGRLDDAVLEHTRLINPSNASLGAGMAATALAFAREAVRHADAVGHAGLLTTALYSQARAEVRLADGDAARASMARCHAVFATLGDASIRARYLADITQADAEVQALSAPAEAIRLARESQTRFVAVRAHQRLLALAVTEARAHRALGDVEGARGALLRGVAIVDAQQSQINRRDFLPSFVDASWDVFSELVDLEAAAGRAEAALEWLDRGYDVRGHWHGATSVSLASVSQAGPVVAFLSRPDALWAWVIRDGRVQQRRVAVPRAELARRAARLAHVLTLDPAHDAVDMAITAVAADAWWPIVPLIGDGAVGRLALVLDPVLQRVPFALLPWDAAGGARVVDRAAVALCPSVRACAAGAGLPPAIRVAALHAGQGGDGLARLPEARAEAERIGRRYAGAAVDVATADTLAQAIATDDLVHFAGHAVPDERYPGRSQLLLASAAGDGVRVPLARLLEGDVRARLVVLSACRTSRAEARRGDGGAGVAGEFLRAGVAQVIASQWDVRDDLAAEAMDDVHEALGTGAAPWDAVRLAQQRLRARGVAARDWAGYVAYTTPARR